MRVSYQLVKEFEKLQKRDHKLSATKAGKLVVSTWGRHFSLDKCELIKLLD